MRINTNIASLTAQANNSQVNKTLNVSLEKLSSGLKINKASDDASGMSIADKLRTQASSIGQGIANANSGSALIQIADKAMSEQSSILDIVKTKLLQASTSTTSAEGREAIRKDVQKLLQQLDNISTQTTYNGVNLLDKEGSSFNFQVGEKSTDIIGLSTAYSVNTKGLGSENATSTNASGKIAFADKLVMKGSYDNVSVTARSSASGAVMIQADASAGAALSTGNAGDAAFKVSAKDVTGMTFKASTVGTAKYVYLNTDDATLIAALDLATSDDDLTKMGDGSYRLGGAVTNAVYDFTFANGESVDISNLKVTGLTQGTAVAEHDAFSISTKEAVTIEKISGNKDLQIDGVTAGGVTSAGTLTGTTDALTSEAIKYNQAIALDSGTMSVKSNSTAGEYIAINATGNTAAINGSPVVENLSMTVDSTNVKSISVIMGAGTSSVDFSAIDSTLNKTLTNIAQTSATLSLNTDGTFTLTASSSGANSIIDFGSDGIDISGLKISGIQKGTAANLSEAIYIKTTDSVSITNNSASDISGWGELDIQTATDTTIAALTTTIDGADVAASFQTGSLEGLTSLKKDGLTAEIANKFMTIIDIAMTQLNSVRSDFGSTQNQLEVATRNMMTTRVNIKAAESIIRDVDYAEESANFNKQNIIAQAGTYAMSQANNVQQNIMRLLQ